MPRAQVRGDGSEWWGLIFAKLEGPSRAKKGGKLDGGNVATFLKKEETKQNQTSSITVQRETKGSAVGMKSSSRAASRAVMARKRERRKEGLRVKGARRERASAWGLFVRNEHSK